MKERTAANTGNDTAVAFDKLRSIRRFLIYLSSLLRYSPIRFKNGTSHAKYFSTRILGSNSCRSLARLSVHAIERFRNWISFFIATDCNGKTMMRKPNPTSEETPRLVSKRIRQMINCIGAVQEKWKKPMQKSIRDTSGKYRAEDAR